MEQQMSFALTKRTRRRITLPRLSSLVVLVVAILVGVIALLRHASLTRGDVISIEEGQRGRQDHQQQRQLQDNYMFPHGVASFDPTDNQVIIWTRVETTDSSTGGTVVSWMIATDDNFSYNNSIVDSGTTTTSANQDYTVKVDVHGLKPHTLYFYRFKYDGVYSSTGRTKTAPTRPSSSSSSSYSDNDDEQQQQVRFAMVSCSNYQAGWFHAYDQIYHRDDVDAVIHLGDYIYDYENGRYGDVRILNAGERTITLTDYRRRYSEYRLDPSLQRLHGKYPFITTWDDHEYSNNAWVGGAGDHEDEVDGDWTERKNAANQAYLEWLPFRVTRTLRRRDQQQKQERSSRDKDSDGGGGSSRSLSVESSYRKLQYGSLVDIFVLDNRILARDMQPASLGGFHPLFVPDNYDEGRAMLGQKQMQWIKDGLKYSKAKWKVIAQPVPMAPVTIIPGVLGALPDAWNGYSAARAELLDHIANKNIDNVVILSGDIHATAVSDIPKERTTELATYTDWLLSWPSGSWLWTKYTSIAVEFVVTSVSSANLFDSGFFLENIPLGVEIADFLVRTVGLCINNHVRFFDSLTNGYQVVDFQPHQAQTDIYVTGKPTEKYDTLDDKKRYQRSYRTRDGKNSIERAYEQTQILWR